MVERGVEESFLGVEGCSLIKMGSMLKSAARKKTDEFRLTVTSMFGRKRV